MSNARQPVESSHLKSVGYDKSTKTLTIEFKNQRVYKYFDVPPSVHKALMKASSHGKYFHQHIRGVYRYSRV